MYINVCILKNFPIDRIFNKNKEISSESIFKIFLINKKISLCKNIIEIKIMCWRIWKIILILLWIV